MNWSSVGKAICLLWFVMLRRKVCFQRRASLSFMYDKKNMILSSLSSYVCRFACRYSEHSWMKISIFFLSPVNGVGLLKFFSLWVSFLCEGYPAKGLVREGRLGCGANGVDGLVGVMASSGNSGISKDPFLSMFVAISSVSRRVFLIDWVRTGTSSSFFFGVGRVAFLSRRWSSKGSGFGSWFLGSGV